MVSRHRQASRAFTLVELIVVIIILAILAAVGIPQYRKSLERSRGAEAYAGLAAIQEGEKIYYATNEAYYNGALDNSGEAALDIQLPQKGWTFALSGANNQVFTGTATRNGGPCVNNAMTIIENGALNDNVWRGCIDNL